MLTFWAASLPRDLLGGYCLILFLQRRAKSGTYPIGVFDCSARFGGTSLNDKLLQGPDLTNQLVGVLTRFRKEPMVFMGDIDAMFHQVRVPEGQRDFLRFLWWPDGDLTQGLEEYQMNVHLLRAVSSPSCSNFTLRKAADDAEKIVGTEAAVLQKNFYVDDCLRSEGKEDTAIERYVTFAMLAPRKGLIWPSSLATTRKFSKVSRKKCAPQK